MHVEVARQVQGEWWNSRLQRSPDATIFQTWHWAEYLRTYLDEDPYFLSCVDASGDVMGMALVVRSSPRTSFLVDRPFGRLAIAAAKRVSPRYSCLYGPVVFAPAELRSVVVDTLVEELRHLAGAHRIADFTLPHALRDSLSESQRRHFRQRRWGTYLIDLARDEGELWSGLRSSARKCVRHARELGVSVEIIDGESGLREFHPFLRATTALRGVRCFPVRNLVERYRCLAPIAGEDIYVARYGERIACSLGIWRFNGWIHEFGANQAAFSTQQRLYAADLVKWEIIRREAELAGKRYDLCGVNPQPDTDKERGIRQYKKKWGGRYVEYTIYSTG